MNKPVNESSFEGQSPGCNSMQDVCTNPACKNQNVGERGPGTRRDISDFRDGKVQECPMYAPKLIGTVNMGENSMIDLKIARTGVRGNRLRTDRCAIILGNHLDQAFLDRHALRILR